MTTDKEEKVCQKKKAMATFFITLSKEEHIIALNAFLYYKLVLARVWLKAVCQLNMVNSHRFNNLCANSVLLPPSSLVLKKYDKQNIRPVTFKVFFYFSGPTVSKPFL